MLETLELSSLEQRRSVNRLVFMYKVVEGLVPAIPADEFLKPKKPKRPRKYTDYITKNLVDRHSVNNDRCFEIENCNTDSACTNFLNQEVMTSRL